MCSKNCSPEVFIVGVIEVYQPTGHSPEVLGSNALEAILTDISSNTEESIKGGDLGHSDLGNLLGMNPDNHKAMENIPVLIVKESDSLEADEDVTGYEL